MSHCRFIEADAYIFDHCEHGLYCCGCSIEPRGEFIGGPSEDPESAGRMLVHIAKHRANGDYIPASVDDRIMYEAGLVESRADISEEEMKTAIIRYKDRFSPMLNVLMYLPEYREVAAKYNLVDLDDYQKEQDEDEEAQEEAGSS